MRASIAEFFSIAPEGLFAQAFWCGQGPFIACDGSTIHLMCFARYARIDAPDGLPTTADGQTLGVQLVAYFCDENGRVRDWERRYHVEAVGSEEQALRKLRLQLANGFARFDCFEGYLEEAEAIRREHHRFDWATMPIQPDERQF